MIYNNRPVKLPENRTESFRQEFASQSLNCREEILALCELLRRVDPDMEHRIGLLHDKYELYALPVPRSRGLKLMVSVNIRTSHRTMFLHGLASGRGITTRLKRRATEDFGLINPIWEPSK